MHPFEQELLVSTEESAFKFRFCEAAAWSPFWLNPRRTRGSDFLMRWSQGRWSEDLLIKAVNETGKFVAIPYGPSSTAPDNDVRAFELYFERLEAAGLGQVKRPDLLIFHAEDVQWVRDVINSLGGEEELPFITEYHPDMQRLVRSSLVAVECENSLWKSRHMPDYGVELKPMRRLGGKLGVKKSAVLPTVIIKDEDRGPLKRWQLEQGIPIHVWHAFYDLAFGLSLNEAERLIEDGFILPYVQEFQSPGGATTKKSIYKYPYLYAYNLAEAVEEPSLHGRFIEDKNGHILPYVHFEGGRFRLSDAALKVLESLS